MILTSHKKWIAIINKNNKKNYKRWIKSLKKDIIDKNLNILKKYNKKNNNRVYLFDNNVKSIEKRLNYQ